MQVEIRPERPEDAQVIFDITAAAFAPKAFSDGTEAALIGTLRDDGDLTLSLAAAREQQVVGHVAFSPVTLNGQAGDWYGLGPVAVRPDLQGTGIGSLLITNGLRRLKTMGAAGCALIGDPNYYSRFGFRSDGKLHYANVPDRNVQWLSFGNQAAQGQLQFRPAFGE
ncbi:putative acetyltransferase [Monaibacterium marinum]|uniref:Putative acetyltransferase n=1 Tax=Pontivivens marinum TaxID=1690039 RepID=A0A2C9CN75_9RHOB|nr:N-acetyltransferase [Monaibacterium marinum]SOH92668.1 putative acetyltransferase [Monaibacterium marinum]